MGVTEADLRRHLPDMKVIQHNRYFGKIKMSLTEQLVYGVQVTPTETEIEIYSLHISVRHAINMSGTQYIISVFFEGSYI